MRARVKALLTVLFGLAICSRGSGGQPTGPECSRSASANIGVIEGTVVSASTGSSLDSATVSAHWVQLTRRSRDYDLLPVSIDAVMSGAHYRLCGLPVNAPVRLRVSRPGYREIEGEIVAPSSSVVQRDIQLVAVAATQGTAIVSGRVVRSDSAPVSSGSVVIRSLDREARIVDGRFVFAGVPTGSWAIEARALGYTPGGVIVDASADKVASATIVLTEREHILDGVTTTAVSSGDVRTLNAILARKRVGFGTFVLPGDPRLERALDLADVVKMAPGFHVRNDDTIEARHLKSGRCIPTIYVDGMRNPLYIGIENVLAVAAFPDMAGVPVEYRDTRNCAVILVWMKR